MTRIRSPTGCVSSPKTLSTVVLNPASEVAAERSSSVTPSGRRAEHVRAQPIAGKGVGLERRRQPDLAAGRAGTRETADPRPAARRGQRQEIVAFDRDPHRCRLLPLSDRSRLAGRIEKQEARSPAGPRAGQQQGAATAGELVGGEALRVRPEDPGEVDRQDGARASPKLQGRALDVENRKRAADRGEPIPG